MNEKFPYKVNDLAWPALKALKSKGGSVRVKDLMHEIIKDFKIPSGISKIPHNKFKSELQYRLEWALTYLNKIGDVYISERGARSITDSGINRKSEDEVKDLIREKQNEESRKSISKSRRLSR